MKNYRIPPHREDPSWPDLQSAARYFEAHLHATGVMVIECVYRGDKTGAEWTISCLLQWFHELHFRFDVHSFFFRRGKLLTFEINSHPWEEAKRALDLEAAGYIQQNVPRGLFVVALQNYWVDVCCIVAYMLAIRGKNCPCVRSLPAELLRNILYGQTPHPDGRAIDGKSPIKGANELFVAILRQYHSEGGYRRGYRARLDGIVGRLAQIAKEEMVPGRIYTGWGIDDLDSLRDGQIILLILMVPERWNPMASIDPIVREWVRDDDAKLRELLDHLKNWKERISLPDFTEYRGLFECVKTDQGALTFEKSIESLKNGIEEIVLRVEAIREETIRDLPVSGARLEEVGKWGSKLAFSKTSGAFPLSLFESVSYSEIEFQSRSLVIKGLAKGEFTEPPMAQRASNEEEWFSKTIRNHVASSVLAEAISRLNPVAENASSPEIYWEQMKRFSEGVTRSGRNAILLIENRTAPGWVYEWTDRYRDRRGDIPPDLEAWRDPKFEQESYLGNLNNTAVYLAAIQPGASFLLTAESFKSASFTKFPNENFVLAEALSIEGKPAIVDLRLTWRFELEISPFPAMKLVHGEHGRPRAHKGGGAGA